MKCPKCGSENVVEFMPDAPAVSMGLPKKYRGYDCKDCGKFFRIPIIVGENK